MGIDVVDFNKTQAFKIVNEHLTIENKSIVKQTNLENKSIYDSQKKYPTIAINEDNKSTSKNQDQNECYTNKSDKNKKKTLIQI